MNKCFGLFLILGGLLSPIHVYGDQGSATNKSVYLLRPWADVPALVVFAAGAYVPLQYEASLVHGHCPCDPHDVNSFDRTAIGNHNKTAGTLSDVTVALAIVAPMALDTRDVGFNKTLAEDFVVYAQVLSLNTAISNIARYGVQRPRPDVYAAGANTNATSEYLSFYSGHVASTFAALSAASMTYNYRYGPHWWPWLVTVGVGVGESVLRTAAGRHFPTDNIAGAVMGTAVGIAVPMLHRRHSDNQITLAPEASGRGAELVWRRAF